MLEVLFDVAVLVVDVQAGVDPGGDHPGPVAIGRGWSAPRQSSIEEHADAIRTAEVEVVADHPVEKMAPVQRSVEDLGEADLDLPEAELMTETGAPIFRRQGPGQAAQR